MSSDNPGDGPQDPNNPFKGTPFEHLFGGGQMGGGLGDLGALFGQIQSLFQPYDGPVNWDVVADLARKTVMQGGDPSPTQRQSAAVADALQLADHWLEGTTAFPSGVTTTAAWSRSEWIVHTLDVWKVLVEPLAASSVQAMGNALPEQMRGQAGPLLGMMGKAMGAMYGSQLGSGLGTLAGEVLSVSDIGLPLGPSGKAALLPTNVASFAEGLDVSADDVLLYLALREAAHQRLFAGVPWLRDHVVETVRDFAQGVELNLESMQQRLEEQLRGFDPTNLSSMQELMEGGLFDMPESPVQRAARERLEVVLALIEGWVDEIVVQATAERMPAAPKLAEAVRRRRAAGGPAEQTFANLVGLQMRPRRLRDASTLWGSLRTRQGVEARDGVWMHPHLLPTATDLDDPLTFREDAVAPAELSDEDWDAGLRELLGDEPGEQPGDQPGPESAGGSEGPEDAGDTGDPGKRE